MESLLERVVGVLDTHPHPALPLTELRRLVRGSGVAVGEEALLRALSTGRGRIRLIDPWRGPWVTLRLHARLRGGVRRLPRASPNRSEARATGRNGDREAGATFPGAGVRWVVARPGPSARPSENPVLRRLRQTVAHLGWTVDEGSPSDLARWCRMTSEVGRVRDRWTRGAG